MELHSQQEESLEKTDIPIEVYKNLNNTLPEIKEI